MNFNLRKNIYSELFFTLIFLIIVAYTVDVSKLGYFGRSLIAAIIVIFIVVERSIDFIFNHIFSFLGICSGNGPLQCHLKNFDKHTEITITNNGKYLHNLAAIFGYDKENKRMIPTPFLNLKDFQIRQKEELVKQFSKLKLKPKESITIYLNNDELKKLYYNKLMIIDAKGYTWDVHPQDSTIANL